MTMFKLEKGIPLPKSTKRGKMDKYPLKDMEVGDSFLIPGKGVGQMRPYSSINRVRKDTGFTFTTQSVTDGLRIWRVK